jgi:hypothetical protein
MIFLPVNEQRVLALILNNKTGLFCVIFYTLCFKVWYDRGKIISFAGF